MEDSKFELIRKSEYYVDRKYFDFTTLKYIDKYNQSVPTRKITAIIDNLFALMEEPNPFPLFINITKSNSVFFRFTTISGYEFKFDIFYDYDLKDESDIECILHIYKDGIKENSFYGSVNELFNIVKQNIAYD